MKKAIFITVRCGSTRLPYKALLKVRNKTMIEHLIDRLKTSVEKDIIVLCTTLEREDDVLCQIAKDKEILCFRGSTKDKLARWMGAAKENNVDFFVTADGDDIFCEPELIDIAFKQYERLGVDFIEGGELICGVFTYGIKASALEKVCSIKDTEDTEMMWVYFKDTGLFRCGHLENVPDVFKRPEIRMTLDYEDDFKFFKTVMEHFGNREFTLLDIVEYLDENPEVVQINQYLQKSFLENQKNKTSLKLKNVRIV